MWTVVSGAPGSAKHEVAKYLAKQGFIYEEQPTVEFDESLTRDKMFELQLATMLSRYQFQRDVQVRAAEDDIVTVGSFWDSHEVYAAVLSYLGRFSSGDYMNLDRIYKALGQTLDAPHKLIYMTSTKLNAEAKLKVQSRTMMNEEIYDAIANKFRVYIDTRVRIPYQEIDLSDKSFDLVLADVAAAVSYTEKTAATTMWRKSYLK